MVLSIGTEFRIVVVGLKSSRGGDPRINASLFWGVYESAEIRFIRSFLDGSLDVVELGSSLGGLSCEIARKVKGDRKLVCIEANPHILSLLQRNLKNNAPNKNYRLIFGAINYDGNSHVDFSIGGNNLSSHLGSDGAKQKVPSLSLSHILEVESIDDYALVCDIEGAEAQIFNYDYHALSRCRTLVIELHRVRLEGIEYNTDSLISLIVRNTALRLVSRYGDVCAFTNNSV